MSGQRSNLIWPVLIIGVGITMLLISANVIPQAIGDVLIRSWPVLLIIFGLNVLLAQRLPYANWLVLGGSIVLVVVVANMAYAERRGEYRDDYREARTEVLPPEVESLEVVINLRETRATISPAAEPRQIVAQFAGSNESEVSIALDVEGTVGRLTITEDRPGVLPRLSEVGRGTLNVFLPADVPVEVLRYRGDDGSVTADLQAMQVRALDMRIQRGNMNLCLPRQGVVLQDAVSIDNGNLRVVIPDNRPARFTLGNQDTPVRYVPEDISSEYQLLVGGVLERRLVQNFEILLNLNVADQLTIDHTTCDT